ncbi:hypothetical protein FZEAL_9703 [Fusarium zealandicum]|uniref:Uncharacterized protein n=1 Tax=Fusarium zealandicum TaxID=1053134 RepID=A0A8H4U9C9_9HYPO|nr:hypothetical protein FZEAL_9703 [Fusarium zealandicum]
MTVSKYRSRARGETTKRLVAQLVNEGLATLSLAIDDKDSCSLRARITGQDSAAQWMTLPINNGLSSTHHLRPNDLQLPVTLFSDNKETIEDDPGSVFAFTAAWFLCDEKTKTAIVAELRNSAAMLEKWMELESNRPVLDVNSSFLDWETSLVSGHPTHPFHRTCFASSLLEPVGANHLPAMLHPSLSFFAIPRSSVWLFGPFVNLIEPLLRTLGIPCSNDGETNITVPCLSQHLPALLHFFPEASVIKTIPNCAVAQAAMRTVSVPGYAYDLKMSLACLITSALRVLPCWSAATAPTMTFLLKRLLPPELWLFGEWPKGGYRTYAEILFNLHATTDKARWHKMYIECLLPLALDPLRRHGVGFEFHAQNAVVQVCQKTKVIKGFAISDLAGVKLHGPTLQAQGHDLTGLEAATTNAIHEVWNRVHHALIQNHVGYMLYALGLDREGWAVVRSVLRNVLANDGDSVGGRLVENTAPYGELSGAARQLSPYPDVLPPEFLKSLELFHESLALALGNIIGRWWKDTAAVFPGRMPLEPRVEALLQWIDRGSDKVFIRPYKGNQGNLRPDILIPAEEDEGIPRFKVCEINGRFPISFLHLAASSYQALADTEWHNPSMRPATDHNKLFDGLFELFNPSVPIHFVGETSDFPPDSPLFGLLEQRTGMRPRSVKPSSLRLIPSETFPTGFALYCLWGADINVRKRPANLLSINEELLEELHQVGLQLYDFELFALAPEMVRQIAMRSVNDPRIVFIAHDKRILGIILQELDALVHKHGAITCAQAQLLRDGIVPTILPCSPELKALLASRDVTNKDNFILKPFRLARGSGIQPGKDLASSEWCSVLEAMQKVDFRSETTQYLLQPLLQLRSVNWFWDEQRKVRKSRMVGTYFSVHGRFVGLGMWRTASVSEDIISASTKDATVVLSVVYVE